MLYGCQKLVNSITKATGGPGGPPVALTEYSVYNAACAVSCVRQSLIPVLCAMQTAQCLHGGTFDADVGCKLSAHV